MLEMKLRSLLSPRPTRPRTLRFWQNWVLPTWAKIGTQKQSAKKAAVAKYADMVHSVDRPKLVRALNQGAESAGRMLDCLVQVDFDTTDPGRAGVEPDKALELADLVSQSDHLHLAGLMVVAPLGVDPEPVFAQLATLSKQLQELHPSASVVSAGMSQDFATAIKYGTTHVRIGRSILGNR